MKETDTFRKILDNINRHIKLSDEEIDYLISHIQRKIICKKDFLLQEGEICRTTTFVNYGFLKSYYLDDTGKHIIQFASPDWWIGDLESYVKETPSKLYISALQKTEVFQISKLNMEKIYTQIPKFERFFRIKMENALISHQSRILQALTLKSKLRYENFVEAYPDLHKQLPLKDVANYLGITPEHLSAIRAKH